MAVAVAVAVILAAGVACSRHPKGTSTPTRATAAAPAAGAIQGRVTVRIAWQGRPEPPRAAHLKPEPAADEGAALEVTIEAPDTGLDDASESDANAEACDALPADLRTRRFAATMTGVAPSADPMSVFASSHSVPPHGTPYRTVVVEGPTIQEQVSPTTFLAIDGVGARSLAAANPTTVTVPWSGDFETCELRAPGETELGCGARPDQLVRRSVCHFTNALLTIRRR
jgi:hypothetical protein